MANGDIKQITLPQSSGGGTYNIVDQGARDLITALEGAMVFKGTLGTGGTISTLPVASASNKGFTYKVITDGSSRGISYKAGDTVISDGSAWVLIPSGDEPSGTVTNIATGTGLTGGPITSTGTISVDTNTIATRTYAETVGPVTSVAGKTGVVTLSNSDVGLGNVGNFKAVSTVASQGLNSTEQANARANIGAGTSNFSGSYTDLSDKPTIPTLTDSTSTTSSTVAASATAVKAAYDHYPSAATTTTAGLMSAADKTKINNLRRIFYGTSTPSGAIAGDFWFDG